MYDDDEHPRAQAYLRKIDPPVELDYPPLWRDLGPHFYLAVGFATLSLIIITVAALV